MPRTRRRRLWKVSKEVHHLGPRETITIVTYWDQWEEVEVGLRFSKRAVEHRPDLAGCEIRVPSRDAATWLSTVRPDHFLRDGTCGGGCGVERYWDWAP